MGEGPHGNAASVSRPVIVLGSSPLGPEAYRLARGVWPHGIVVTCNRGLRIEPQPDFYFLSDCKACQLWSRDGHQAAKGGRTKCVTLRRDPQAMKMRTVDDFDIVVREGHPFEPFQLSGLWCVEFAIRVLYADIVVLCGMDGYRPDRGVTDYFAGADTLGASPDLGKNHTAKIVVPLTDKLASKYPDVLFLQIGEPCFTVNRPNWKVQSVQS